MRYYDPNNNRLLYIESRASENYWDKHWGMADDSMLYKPEVSPFNFVVNITRKYLPKTSFILEGGAGLAQNSWYLYLAGYRTIALDFAPKTVEFLKQHRPEVCPVLGDVRNLSLENESVDGYWSLGVIEHFYEGFDKIIQESYRILRKNGYFFISFPYMSPLRRVKAFLKKYPLWRENDKEVKRFYQFAFDKDYVRKSIESTGFRLCFCMGIDGLKGFKDEVTVFQSYLQRVYDSSGLTARVARRLINILLNRVSGHSLLLVFKKNAK